MDLDKLEPSTLNHESRQTLVDALTPRIQMIEATFVSKGKGAIDRALFARNHALTEPMYRVETFLRESAKLLQATRAALKEDIANLHKLADQAGRIGRGEE